jgi:hypothetical protein
MRAEVSYEAYAEEECDMKISLCDEPEQPAAGFPLGVAGFTLRLCAWLGYVSEHQNRTRSN